jgi:hypothetical protein
LSRAEAALRRIVADLRDLGRRFALVGGQGGGHEERGEEQKET